MAILQLCRMFDYVCFSYFEIFQNIFCNILNHKATKPLVMERSNCPENMESELSDNVDLLLID